MNFHSSLDNGAVIISSSSDDTRELGVILGHLCYPGLTVLMYGGLGAGKTMLTQGIGTALGYKKIKSPTFIILSEHEGPLPMVHADLYRLEKCSDIDSLDLESYTDQGSLLIVEWAERWKSVPPSDRWDITIDQRSGETESRRITITACGDRAYSSLLTALQTLQRER